MMLKGPRGESRPADAFGNAVRIMRIATGEEQETPSPVRPEGRAGQAGPGGPGANMTPKARAEQAKRAAAKIWAKD